MIPRGYMPKYKVTDKQEDQKVKTIYKVECPLCKHQMELQGEYSENIHKDTTCSNCHVTLSGYNFTYIDSTLK